MWVASWQHAQLQTVVIMDGMWEIPVLVEEVIRNVSSAIVEYLSHPLHLQMRSICR